MIHERLKEYDDNPFHGVSLAIVPSGGGEWTVVTQHKLPKREPDLATRISTIESQLRQQYTLKAQ
jgi:hypothetical protein